MARMSAAALKTARLLLLLFSCSILHSSFAQHLKSTLKSSNSMSKQQQHQNRQQLIQVLRGSLLNALGMKKVPSGKRRNVQIPHYILDMYTKHVKNEFSTNFNAKNKMADTANVIRHHYHQDGEIDEQYSDKRFMFKFNLSSVPPEEVMKASELSVHLGPSETGEKLTVDVYDVLKPATSRSPQPILRLIDTTTVNVYNTTSQWLSFDVMPAVLRTVQQISDKIVRLYVTARTTSKKSNLRLKRSTDDDQYRAYLLTYSDDGRGGSQTTLSRMKRASSRKNRRRNRGNSGGGSGGKGHGGGEQRDNCRRHSLYVDFSDVGWNDWIVAPPGYEAYYCRGECPYPLADHLNSTNHALVQTLVNSVNPGAVPRACCVPTELSPISMLYLDEYDKVVLKNYQDMVAEGCGCR